MNTCRRREVRVTRGKEGLRRWHGRFGGWGGGLLRNNLCLTQSGEEECSSPEEGSRGGVEVTKGCKGAVAGFVPHLLAQVIPGCLTIHVVLVTN